MVLKLILIQNMVRIICIRKHRKGLHSKLMQSSIWTYYDLDQDRNIDSILPLNNMSLHYICKRAMHRISLRREGLHNSVNNAILKAIKRPFFGKIFLHCIQDSDLSGLIINRKSNFYYIKQFVEVILIHHDSLYAIIDDAFKILNCKYLFLLCVIGRQQSQVIFVHEWVTSLLEVSIRRWFISLWLGVCISRLVHG